MLTQLVCHSPTHSTAGVEDRGLVYQAEGGATSLTDAIRNVFLRPQPDGESKVGRVLGGGMGCTRVPGGLARPGPAAECRSLS